MSKTDQQSFYEIQLNTHHLLLAFLGAVVVGVSIFYLGVMVGQSQGPESIGEGWQPAASESGEGAVEEPPMDFYDTVREPETAGDTAAAEAGGAGGTTGARPGGEESTALPSAAAETAAATNRSVDQPGDAREATPEQPSPTTTSRPAGIPENDPGLASGWVVQVRSAPERGPAEQLQEALYGAGFPAFVVTADIQGVTYYRVRVGRYGTREEAQRVAEALSRRADVDQTWVTEG